MKLMEFKQGCKFALAVASSVNFRETPLCRQPNIGPGLRSLQVTSAETNVATVLAHLDLPVAVMTALIKGNPDSHTIRRDLRGRGMEVLDKWFDPEGPWGPRHIINKADSGFGGRGAVVTNDRAGEVGAKLSPGHFDIDHLFGENGVQAVHISGLFAAISPSTGQLCLTIAQAAKKHGTKIVFDLNHRASFWEGREEELRQLFCEIASLADVLMGNEEDFQLCLGITGPAAGGKDLASKIAAFKAMITKARRTYPNVEVFTTTLREVVSANENLWGAIMWSKAEGGFRIIEPRSILIQDRIGGGDAFAGGLIYGMLMGWEPEKCLQFAWAAGAYVVTLLEDYFTGFDEKQIWALWSGDARVMR